MKYHYEAFDSAGNVVAGTVDGASESDARAAIRAQGVTPYIIRGATQTDQLFGSIRHPRRKLTERQLARMTRDLAVLLQASVPLEAALRITSSTAENRSVAALAEQMLEGILRGDTLPEVMARNRVFRADHVQIIQAGERKAAYGTAMKELADLLDRLVETKRQVRAALAYPALLVVLAAVSLWIVLTLLVPAVTPIFAENGMPLPGIIAFMQVLREQGFHIVMALLATIVVVGVVLSVGRRHPRWRRELDRLSLSVPVLGRISELREAARFVRTVGSLIRSGVPPLQALETSMPLVTNTELRWRLGNAIEDVRAGVGIGAAIGRTAALPPIAYQLISVGEESGRLQDMLTRAATLLEQQEQLRTSRALAVLTPATTIVVAGLIAAIILSVVSAILSINELVLQ